VRDTLLLGADRIGHGLNLISDDDTMLLMRHGPYLVEINLISNLLLEYVNDYSEHPFPEYLRTGIPVALSTDDRGMWESTMTDEFYVAVTEFRLSWEEIKTLGRNSLAHAFVDDETRKRLLSEYDERIRRFERRMRDRGSAQLGPMPDTRGFVCDRYQLCN
jgi:adenosine deaminase CECR1